jgi:hypothetical protein
MIGYFLRPVNPVFRAAVCAAGLLMVYPGTVTEGLSGEEKFLFLPFLW